MDILFENPLLIAIIIGIISAVFGKIGKQEENEEQNQQKKPAPQRKQVPQKQTKQTSPDPVVTDQLDDFGDVHDHGGMKKKLLRPYKIAIRLHLPKWKKEKTS